MTKALQLDGESLESKVEISAEELDRMREVQLDNPDKGLGMLLGTYIRANGETITSYFGSSEYVKKNNLNPRSVSNKFYGINPFHLNDLKGVVGELGVSDEHLHFVAGRNPFMPTEEELERWSREKGGIGKLFGFYMDLNHGVGPTAYFRDISDYGRAHNIKAATSINWLKGLNPFPSEHLKGFAEELEIPPEYVKRVTGVDLEEVRELTREERLEEMRREQEESKHSKGVGMLLDLYIREKGHSRGGYLSDHSEYVKREGLNHSTTSMWFMGISQFHLKHMKGLAGELEVYREELEFVVGKNPFEVSEKDLEGWSKEKGGVGKLFEFYISLNYAKTLGKYLINNSKHAKGIGVTVNMMRYWFSGNNIFPIEHLKAFADEIGVPYDQVKRVCCVDLEEGITREQLEEMRREQIDTPDKGIGMLLGAYIRTRGDSVLEYLRGSRVVKDYKLNVGTVSNKFGGGAPFRLRNLKGFVDELEVDQEELKYVIGRNPFEVSEEDLKGWSQEKGGIGKLFEFYIDLSRGVGPTAYSRDISDYVKETRVSESTVMKWFYGISPFPPQHLKGFAEELEIPYDQVKRVTDVDIDEVRSAGEEMDGLLGAFLDE